MGRTCFIKKCKSGYRSNPEKVSFFRPPKDPNLLAEWKKVIARYDRELSTNDVICEKHFDKNDIVKTWQCLTKDGSILMEGKRRAKLKKDAIPQFFLGNPKYAEKVGPKKTRNSSRRPQSHPNKQANFVVITEANSIDEADFEVEEILGI